MACKVCGCPGGRWLRVSTVAGQFRCSAQRIRRLIKRGEIDGVRLGGQWRVDHQSLDDYVRKDSVRFSISDEERTWQD